MSDSGRAAARLWAGADLRRRWPSLVALGVLVGITAGFALSALVGARRTHTALARLEQQTHSPTAMVFASQSGVFDPHFEKLGTRPGVQNVAVWDLVFGNCDGEPGCVLFASDDGIWGRDVNKPLVIAGRMWDPSASDEIVIDESLAKQGFGIGTAVKFEMIGPTIQDLVDNNVNGPTATLRVVGVVRDVGQFLFATDGQAFLPPGFVQRYRGQGAIHPNADVVLKKGTDVSSLRKDVNEIVGPGTPVLDLKSTERRVNTTLSVERSALALLALAIAVAGGLLVSQALTRSAATIGDDALVLRAVGLSRWDIASAAGLSHALSAAVAVVVAATTAVVASRWFPVGLGRRIDPDVGFHVDWLVLGPGLLLTLVLVLGGTLLVAARAGTERTAVAPRRASLFATRMRRRAPLTVGLGATMAFDRGRGRGSIPVLPALVGAVVGVLGVVGALTISSGLHDALAHLERAGVTWDLTVEPPPDAYTPTGDAKPAVAGAIQNASGGALAVMNRQLVPVNGIGAPTFSIQTPNGSAAPISFGLLSGRAPRTADEVAIGPATARDLNVNVGDTVQLGDAGAKASIVGEALFPSDVHAEFDEGIWLTPERLDQLVPLDPAMHGRAIAVRLPGGANKAKVQAALQSALPKGTAVSTAAVPVELTNLRNVRTLPVLLAGFLALLAVGALSHVLLTSARRRRREFAVLRALGLDRRRTRLIVNSQATAIGLVGLVIGIPLGVVLGRVLWRLVTDRVPLTNVAPFAVIGVVLIVPITIVVANALALWPGERVARLHPAEILRDE
jgi:ABC-type lipoprotein release transport system permease subunit